MSDFYLSQMQRVSKHVHRAGDHFRTHREKYIATSTVMTAFFVVMFIWSIGGNIHKASAGSDSIPTGWAVDSSSPGSELTTSQGSTNDDTAKSGMSVQLYQHGGNQLGFYPTGITGLTPGDVYQLKFWAKGAGDLDVKIDDGSGNLYNFTGGLANTYTAGSSSDQKFSILTAGGTPPMTLHSDVFQQYMTETAFTVPSTGVLKPMFVPVNDSDNVYLDSVTLYKVAYAPGPPAVITPEGSDLMLTHNGGFDDWSAVDPATNWRADGITLVEGTHPDDVTNSVASITQGSGTGSFATVVNNLTPGNSYYLSFKGITANGSSVATVLFNGDFTQAFNFTPGFYSMNTWGAIMDNIPSAQQFYEIPLADGSRALASEWGPAATQNVGYFTAPADGTVVIVFVPVDGTYSDIYSGIHAGDSVSLDDVTLLESELGSNLIINGDFEDWLGDMRPTSWNFGGAISFIHVGSDYAWASGSAIRLSEEDVSDLGYLYSGGVSSLTPDDQYELTFYAKGSGDLDSVITDGAAFGSMNIYNFDTGLYDSWVDTAVAPSVNQRNRIPLTSSYQLFTVPLFTVGSGTGISAMFAPISSGGYVYLDQVAIRRVTDGEGGRGDNILASLNPGFEDWALSTITILDLTPPTIASSLPASGATGVATTVHPTVTFDEEINPTTISIDTIYLSPPVGDSSVSLSDDGLTATIVPGSALAPNTTYTVNVTSGVHDLAGNLFAGTSYSFTTGLSVLSVSPLDGATDVSTNTSAITATFNETVSLVNPNDFQVETYDSNLGDYVVVGSLGIVSVNSNVITLAPINSSLPTATLYRITVKTTIGEGTSGNVLPVDYTWQFTTASSTGTNNDTGTSPVVFSSTVISDLPTTNGIIYAQAKGSDDKFYIGGSFTEVNGQPRHGLAAIGDGGQLSSWNPGLDSGAVVYSLAVYGDDIIAGGNFTYQAKANIAAFQDIDGSQDPTFAVENPNGPVRAIVVDSTDHVIAGGDFTAVGSNDSCAHVLLYKLGDGTVCSDHSGLSSLTTNGSIHSLAVTPNSDGGQFLLAGGTFTQAGGLSHAHAALWLVNDSPSLSSWNPNITGESVDAIAFDNVNPVVYLGGSFTQSGGTDRMNLAAYNFDQDGIPLNTSWNPSIAGGVVKTIIVNNTAVYVGGSFTSVGGGSARSGAASFTRANGSAVATAESWSPVLTNTGTVNSFFVGTDMILAGGEFADQGYLAAFQVEVFGGVLPVDSNGNYLCDLGGGSWNDLADSVGMSHIFFRTTGTGDLEFGYGYGFTADDGWKYGFGFGYGYDTFCSGLDSLQDSGSRAGYFFFEATLSPTMNLAAVLNTDTEIHSVDVPDDMTLSLSGEGEGSEVLLPANMTMGAVGWDGTVAVTFNTTSVPTGMSSGTVVDVDFGGVSGQPIKLSGAALVVIPQVGFNSSTGLVKIIGTDGLPYVAGECTGEQYNDGDKGVVGSYTLGNYFSGAVSAQQCYTHDTIKVYVATNHFSSFAAGTATVVSTPTPNGGLPAPTPLMVGKIQTLVQEKAAQNPTASDNNPNSTTPSAKKVDAFPPNSLKNFKDLLTLGKNRWQYPIIQQMLELGLMNGSTDAKGDKYWRMNASMSRAEAAVLIARYAGFNDKTKITTTTRPFADVAKSEWYAASVDYLKTLGVISGKTPTAFEPEAKITRMEFFKIAVSTYMELHPDIKNHWMSAMERNTATFADVSDSDWFHEYVSLAESEKLLTGFIVNDWRLMRPSHDISRVEAAAMLSKLIGLK